MNEPYICQICQGPIQVGEPIVAYDDGVAHRFKTTCEWFKKRQEEALKTGE